MASSAKAQSVEKIAAIVNDDVISYFDLDMRLSLIISASNAQDTAEARRRMAPQVLRRLIDENLQQQEAKRLNIAVTDADLQRALTQIEKQNNVAAGQLDTFLKRQGADKLALIGQLEAEIAWAKVVGRRIRPQIQVDSEEVDETLARMAEAKGKPEHLLAEIFLRVDDPANEREVEQLAKRIMQQIKAGAGFSALARNFSQSASAANGGNLGWIRQGELEDQLEQIVSKISPGGIAGPVRTLGGFHILFLRQRRIAEGLAPPDVTLTLQQLFFPVAQDAAAGELDRTMKQARSTAAEAASCTDMEAISRELGTPLSGSLGRIKLEQLPPQLRNAVETLEINRSSEPVRTENGFIVLMVCEREGNSEQTTIRRRIEQMLFAQRVDAAARRHLRDLRRAAFIDIRI